MRIAVVLSHLPLPEGSAAGRCAVAMIRGLRAQGHELRVLAADSEGGAAAVPADLDAEIVPVSFEDKSPLDRVRRWTKPRTTLANGEFARRAIAISEGVDAVFLDEIDTAPLAPSLSAPALAHLHCWARRDRELGKPWDPLTRDSWQLIRADRRAAKRYPHLAGCSTPLVADIRRAGAHDVQLVRLGLDPAFYKPGKPTKAPIAGLIGSATWPPTRGAVTALLADVWPRIHATLPSAVLRLAGHGMTQESFPGYEHVEGVEWLGEVESASDFLRSLALQLYPVTNGSGTAIKVLESLFLGVPVVTTRDGLEGMSENDGVVVAPGPNEVVKAATELLSDPAGRRKRSKAAIAYANEHHSPAAVGAIFTTALRNISQRGRSTTETSSRIGQSTHK